MPITQRITTAIIGLVLATAISAVEDPGTCPVATASLECSSDIIESMSIVDGSALGLYTCGTPFANVDQSGPEHLYAFACQQSGEVTVVLNNTTCDFDLYVLDDTCNTDTGCLGGDTQDKTLDSAVTFTCVQGETYIITVEGYGFIDFRRGAACIGTEEYGLSVEVGAGTGCPEDCDDTVDNDFDGDTDCDDSDCSLDSICACDMDGDGFQSLSCGGTDCDDTNGLVNPDAPEICGDEIDNDCSASSTDDCTLLVDGFEEDPRIVFTTSAAFNGDLMTAGAGATGLEGADNICNDLAGTAGLPGTYTAWLSDATANAKDRVTQHYSVYRNTNGDKVADNFADILDCPDPFPDEDCLDNPIDYDENGIFIAGAQETWTGTRETGNFTGDNNSCNGWTDATVSFNGRVGRITDTGSPWTSHTARTCDLAFPRLYCFQD